MDNHPATWIVEPFDSPIDLDLSTEGAEWEHYLIVALQEAVSFGSFAGSSRVGFQAGHGLFQVVEYEARDSRLRSRLWVTAEDRRVFVVGDGPEDEAQITPWVQAVVAAHARMSQQHPTFQWVAVIGPAPNAHEPGMGLAAPTTVGPLSLRPSSVRHEEYVRPSMPSFSSRARFWSWPAVVEGRASGFNWWAATEAAIRDVNRLCALISVSCGRAWVVRQAPMEGHAHEVTIPQHAPFEEHHEQQGDVTRHDVTVPSWIGSAWDAATDDQLASDALSAYYEGLLIKDKHPSVGLLAFVAAIEAVGQTLLTPERCACCKMVQNSGERFRKALCLVVSDEEARALKKKAYGPRSKTVHAAKFHGREAVRGAPQLGNFFGIEPPYRFEIDTVRQLEQTSRQLVQRLLKGEIGTDHESHS